MIKEALLKKLENKEALIGVVGLGYVGLPLLLRFAEVGFNVLGIDIDEKKIDLLRDNQSYIKHIDNKRIEAVSENISFTTNFEKTAEADVLILCVPTPLNKFREPDLSYVVNTVVALLPYLHKGQVLSLESTTYPGTTDEELIPRIQKQGLNVGEDFFVLYSPEREDPGNIHFETATIPKVCGGYSKNCLAVGKALYGQVINEVVLVSSTRAAEMTKLLENIHRSVNIGLVNEMKILADKMDIDIHEVIDAAATKPFGFVPYYPGPGIGGHCIPIDPFYLTWKAREYGLHTRFIELAGEINNAMPEWVFNKVGTALNSVEKAIKGSKILILGVAYKPNVDDMRESPSLRIMKLLMEKGAVLSYHDPYVPVMPPMRSHQFDLKSVTLTPYSVAAYDCIVLLTAHDDIDYGMVAENAQLVVDTRGKLRQFASKNIISA